uniref:Uncharacterized protein n=1 Tax=Biomphalaria glabrata TaxID=6526 RepID=A0A2C9LGF8_BIOGL
MIYSVSGLIPFLSVPAYMYLPGSYCSCLAHCQLAYGACILSFLGGVSWGHEMGSANMPAVLLYPNSISFLIMICGVSYAGFRDVLSLIRRTPQFNCMSVKRTDKEGEEG